jgi:TonB family protein
VATEGDAAPSLRSEATPAIATHAVDTHSAIRKQSAHTKPLALQARNAGEPPATKSSVPEYSPALPPAITSRSAPAPLPPARSLPAVPSTPALGSPSASAASSAPDLTNTFRGASPPRLVRRTPEERAEVTADGQPPAATPNTSYGTVRATTLGVSASRVVYSPTPAYPPAASAAHVQGEVKLQAAVDRDGNVASLRVISGPPLLREAALDAAQRWRYRPNMAGGEPTSMSAITVFAFQLPNGP